MEIDDKALILAAKWHLDYAFYIYCNEFETGKPLKKLTKQMWECAWLNYKKIKDKATPQSQYMILLVEFLSHIESYNTCGLVEDLLKAGEMFFTVMKCQVWDDIDADCLNHFYYLLLYEVVKCYCIKEEYDKADNIINLHWKATGEKHQRMEKQLRKMISEKRVPEEKEPGIMKQCLQGLIATFRSKVPPGFILRNAQKMALHTESYSIMSSDDEKSNTDDDTDDSTDDNADSDDNDGKDTADEDQQNKTSEDIDHNKNRNNNIDDHSTKVYAKLRLPKAFNVQISGVLMHQLVQRMMPGMEGTPVCLSKNAALIFANKLRERRKNMRVYMAQLKDEFEEYPNIKPCSRKTASTKTASSQAGSPNKNCRDLKEVKRQENYSESSGSGTPRGATGPLPPRTPRRRSIRDYLVINSPSSKTSSTRLPAKRTKDSDSPGDIKTLRPKRRLLTKCPRLSEGEDFPCGSPVAGASDKVETVSDDDSECSSLEASNISVMSVSTVRRKWTLQEEETFVKGVLKYGPGNWTSIRDYTRLYSRTNVNLKDKYRQLVKCGRFEKLVKAVKKKT